MPAESFRIKTLSILYLCIICWVSSCAIFSNIITAWWHISSVWPPCHWTFMTPDSWVECVGLVTLFWFSWLLWRLDPFECSKLKVPQQSCKGLAGKFLSTAWTLKSKQVVYTCELTLILWCQMWPHSYAKPEGGLNVIFESGALGKWLDYTGQVSWTLLMSLPPF